MAIQEQGFDKGVNLAQKGLNEIRKIGGNLQQMGADYEYILNQKNFNELSSGSLKELEDFAENELKKTDDKISVEGFTEAYKTQRELITEGARNHKVRKLLENQIDSVYDAYSKKLSARKDNYDKRFFNNGVLEGINTRMKESSLFLSQGNSEGATNSYNEAINAIDTLNISELEKENVRKQVKSNYRLNKIDAGINGFYDGVKNNIDNPNTDEAFINEKSINDTSEAFNFAIDDPESNKEFWESYGFEVKENKIIDPETGDFYSAEELEKLKARNSQLQADALNKYNYNNSVKIQEKDLLMKTFKESQINGKPINDLELDIFENTYGKYFNENDINNLKRIREDKQILSIENFNDREKAIEDIKKEDLFKGKQLEILSLKRQEYIVKDPVQYLKNQEQNKMQDIDLFKNNIEETLIELKDRKSFVEEKSDSYGFQIPRLSKDEMGKLSKFVENGNNQQVQEFYNEIYPELTQEERDLIANESFKEKGGKSKFLRMGGIFDTYGSSDQESINKGLSIFNKVEHGGNIRAENKEILKEVMETAKGNFTKDFLKYYSGANAGIRLSNDMDNVLDYSLYLMAEKGMLGEEIPQEIMEQAFRETVGNIVEIGNTRTIAPNSKMNNDDVELALRSLTINNANEINTLPRSVTVEQLTENILDGGWTLEQTRATGIEDNLYYVKFANGVKMLSEEGIPYKLSLSNVKGVIKTEEEIEEIELSEKKELLRDVVSFSKDILDVVYPSNNVLNEVDLEGEGYTFKDFDADFKYYAEPFVRKTKNFTTKPVEDYINTTLSLLEKKDITFFQNIGLSSKYKDPKVIKKIKEDAKKVDSEFDIYKDRLFKNIKKDVETLLSVIKNKNSSSEVKNKHIKRVSDKVIKDRVEFLNTAVDVFDYNNHILGTFGFTLSPKNIEKEEDNKIVISILEDYLKKEGK